MAPLRRQPGDADLRAVGAGPQPHQHPLHPPLQADHDPGQEESVRVMREADTYLVELQTIHRLILQFSQSRRTWAFWLKVLLALSNLRH